MSSELILTVSDFVAVFNQTIEYAYPSVTIVGELSNFRVSKGRWVYFDLKDELSSVKFFGTVYQLPGPLEDGLVVQVTGQPRLHQQFGFSVTAQTIQPVGEGSLKRAAALLESKLRAEGLFDESRKRTLPYPPKRIGLVTSSESAAYHDFMKILNARWGGVAIELADVQVQGERAPAQIADRIEYFSAQPELVDAIVVTRGGGSAEDLAAFNTEEVVRAVATSRIPTLVAIGHEVDISLAELAADVRASTPSNAAELLTPDKQHELRRLISIQKNLVDLVRQTHESRVLQQEQYREALNQAIANILNERRQDLVRHMQLLAALSPMAALQRGYAIIRAEGHVISSAKKLKPGDEIEITLRDGPVQANITSIEEHEDL